MTDIRTSPRYGLGEPECEISSRRSFRSSHSSDTPTHTNPTNCSSWITKVVDNNYLFVNVYILPSIKKTKMQMLVEMHTILLKTRT